VDPRLRKALAEQLVRRRELLDAGAAHVGWKLGMGERERIGDGPVVGYLTSATLLEPGSEWPAGDAVALHADAELSVRLGPDGEIAGCGAALELVDLDPALGDPQTIVAGNVFHRAVAFGSLDRPLAQGDIEGQLRVNGELRAADTSRASLRELVAKAGALLEGIGLQLLEGDRLITGAIVQVPVGPGDEVAADLGPLGSVCLTVE
jgi:2-keto-4-pentenoate hydratase